MTPGRYGCSTPREGISKIQYVDEAFVVEKYGGVAPSQYADMATLRGDTSDGLPGVPGIGEKTAASLLRMFGDLDGVIAAVDDPTSSISPRIRASLIASATYLSAAPAVVRVVRDLPVPAAPTGPPAPDVALLEAIGAEFGISNSVKRILERDLQTSEVVDHAPAQSAARWAWTRSDRRQRRHLPPDRAHRSPAHQRTKSPAGEITSAQHRRQRLTVGPLGTRPSRSPCPGSGVIGTENSDSSASIPAHRCTCSASTSRTRPFGSRGTVSPRPYARETKAATQATSSGGVRSRQRPERRDCAITSARSV